MDDIETMLGQPPSDNIFADLCRDDERLRQSLEKHMRNVFAPELRKEMRTFSPSEAASLIGVTVSNLRKLHQRVELALKLGKVRLVGVRAVHCRRALVYRRKARTANLKRRKLVVRDLDRVARVALRSQSAQEAAGGVGRGPRL